MKRKTAISTVCKQATLILFSSVCLSALGGCQNEGTTYGAPQGSPSNPNQPVVFTDFTPNEGPVRTRMYINGENFGTDISLIDVFIGGQKAKVIHSSDKQIYCMVPARASGGYVEVTIKNPNGNEYVKHTFDQRFTYHFNEMVGTLWGKVDENGNSSVKDGSFEEAETIEPRLALFDDKDGRREIYFCEGNKTIRKMNLATQEVTTILKSGSVDWKSINTMCWSKEKDTLFVNNVTNVQDAPGIYYFLRKENFQIPHNCVIMKNVNCIFINDADPDDWGIYFITKDKSMLYKGTFNPETGLWDPEELHSFGNGGQWYENAVFHPEGKYLYCLARGQHCIQKVVYDPETNQLEKPDVFVGYSGSKGYVDGVGTNARFSIPMQGVFVKNEQYVKEGKDDIYDFYVMDADNHCVRIVSPEGVVTTYAGRGSTTSDGKVNGYIDGPIRTDARFSTPMGLCYEESTATFYVCDKNNRRIRTISVQ